MQAKYITKLNPYSRLLVLLIAAGIGVVIYFAVTSLKQSPHSIVYISAPNNFKVTLPKKPTITHPPTGTTKAGTKETVTFFNVSTNTTEYSIFAGKYAGKNFNTEQPAALKKELEGYVVSFADSQKSYLKSPVIGTFNGLIAAQATLTPQSSTAHVSGIYVTAFGNGNELYLVVASNITRTAYTNYLKSFQFLKPLS